MSLHGSIVRRIFQETFRISETSQFLFVKVCAFNGTQWTDKKRDFWVRFALRDSSRTVALLSPTSLRLLRLWNSLEAKMRVSVCGCITETTTRRRSPTATWPTRNSGGGNVNISVRETDHPPDQQSHGHGHVDRLFNCALVCRHSEATAKKIFSNFQTLLTTQT